MFDCVIDLVYYSYSVDFFTANVIKSNFRKIFPLGISLLAFQNELMNGFGNAASFFL